MQCSMISKGRQFVKTKSEAKQRTDIKTLMSAVDFILNLLSKQFYRDFKKTVCLGQYLYWEITAIARNYPLEFAEYNEVRRWIANMHRLK